MATYTPKASEIQREWHVVDAEGMVLGRLCTEVARILRGKHKPTFAPHIDTGDHVIIVNADKIVMTVEQGRAHHGVPPQRLPGRHQVRVVRPPARPQARRGGPQVGPGHAARRARSAASR